jgi:hypothetical protein
MAAAALQLQPKVGQSAVKTDNLLHAMHPHGGTMSAHAMLAVLLLSYYLCINNRTIMPDCQYFSSECYHRRFEWIDTPQIGG